VDRFAGEEIENRALFDLLLNALKWLGDDASDPLNLARYFELHLLQHVGYRPQLFHCIHCGKEIQPTENFFSIEAGGVIDPDCMQTQRDKLPGHGRDAVAISLNALKILRFLQTREWATVRSLKLNAAAHAEVEALMQKYIAHYLERNLKSIEFLNELRITSHA
jgi:DNA repair protein RecO (recombination protein O)